MQKDYINYNSAQNLVRNLLRNAGIYPKKSLGQNFLIDQNINDIIIESIKPSMDDVIVELGAGLGILTRQIAPLVNKIFAIEFDPDLFNVLQSYCKDFNNIILINDDMLKTNYAQLLNDLLPSQNVKIIGNLPYYITSPIIFMLLEQSKSLNIKSMVLMVQKEVGERIVSIPGNKSYGSLSVAVAYRCKAKIINIVPANCFYPKPKVDSAIIELEVQNKPNVFVEDENLFFSIVRGAFQHRRKTLRNALILSIRSNNKLKFNIESLDNAMRSLDIDPRTRGEDLSINQFANLANMLYNKETRLKPENQF